MKGFIKRLLCRHGPWGTLNIAWDGELTVKCRKCGKVKNVPLGRQP